MKLRTTLALAAASAGLAALPLRSAWAIATARGVYREIGVQVLHLGAHAWDQRVSTSTADKLRLVCRGAARAMLSRHQRDEPRASELWTRPRR